MVFKKIIFQNSLMANETPSRPPPLFMANAILNFHFDFLHTSLSQVAAAECVRHEKPSGSTAGGIESGKNMLESSLQYECKLECECRRHRSVTPSILGRIPITSLGGTWSQYQSIPIYPNSIPKCTYIPIPDLPHLVPMCRPATYLVTLSHPLRLGRIQIKIVINHHVQCNHHRYQEYHQIPMVKNMQKHTKTYQNRDL